jgi:hypothetical protein
MMRTWEDTRCRLKAVSAQHSSNCQKCQNCQTLKIENTTPVSSEVQFGFFGNFGDSEISGSDRLLTAEC